MRHYRPGFPPEITDEPGENVQPSAAPAVSAVKPFLSPAEAQAAAAARTIRAGMIKQKMMAPEPADLAKPSVAPPSLVQSTQIIGSVAPLPLVGAEPPAKTSAPIPTQPVHAHPPMDVHLMKQEHLKS
jgi:hypothetical protein